MKLSWSRNPKLRFFFSLYLSYFFVFCSFNARLGISVECVNLFPTAIRSLSELDFFFIPIAFQKEIERERECLYEIGFSLYLLTFFFAPFFLHLVEVTLQHFHSVEYVSVTFWIWNCTRRMSWRCLPTQVSLFYFFFLIIFSRIFARINIMEMFICAVAQLMLRLNEHMEWTELDPRKIYICLSCSATRLRGKEKKDKRNYRKIDDTYTFFFYPPTFFSVASVVRLPNRILVIGYYNNSTVPQSFHHIYTRFK